MCESDASHHQRVPSTVNNLFKAIFFKQERFYLFLERGEGREKHRERHIHQLPFTCPQRGTRPKTQVCALAGIKQVTFRVCGMTPKSLSHSSQRAIFFFRLKKYSLITTATAYPTYVMLAYIISICPALM